MLPYGRQDIHPSDINEVIEVLNSDFLTQGPVVPKFESSVAALVGAKYAVATNSATSSLHIACLALGLGRGDILWTSPNSFVASANCGIYCGADVDFVDICPKTYNLSVDALEEKLIRANKIGKLPKILVVVHFAGQPVDLRRIRLLSDMYGFAIIEDASHALGSTYLDIPIGSCSFSDITVFSFHPVKMITTGEGGLATTNNQEYCERMQLFRSHGITREQKLMSSYADESWYYEQIELGFNYRMTDIAAALGLSQLKRLKEYVERRNSLASFYNNLLKDSPIITPYLEDNRLSAFHLYVIRFDSKELYETSRKFIFDFMRTHDIGVNVHYIPIHTQPYFRRRGFKIGDYPLAEDYYKSALTLPLFPRLSESDLSSIIDTLFRAIKK